MRKIIGGVLTLLLVGVVVVAVVMGLRGSDGSPAASGNVTQVKGVIGSEKKALLTDPQVVERFKELGYELTIDTAGSREIATQDLSNYDFAFPSSAPAAEKIKREAAGVKKTYTPFFSPMVVATWQPIVEILEPAGVVSKQGDALMFDMAAYLEKVGSDTRWNALPGNTAYPANKLMLVSTTDIRRSNSAAMYMALVTYVTNNNAVVDSGEAVDRVIDAATKVFLAQGFVENSSSGPFGNYVSLGMGQVPMVFSYESQYLSHQIAKDGYIKDTMRLTYPNPTINSVHTVVSLSDAGSEIGRLLTEDEELAKAAARFGFRPTKPGVFDSVVKDAGLPTPPQLVNVVDAPSYEISERLIGRIEAKYGPNAALTKQAPDNDEG